jgi:hypothetical protein
MTYQLIDNSTQKVVFSGATQQECAEYLKTYTAGLPPLTYVVNEG